MALVQVDILQRVRDMSFDVNGTQAFFAPARIKAVDIGQKTYLLMTSESTGIGVAEIGANGSLTFLDAYGTNLERLEDHFFGTSGLTTFSKNGKDLLYLNGGFTEFDGNTATSSLGGISTLKIKADGSFNLLQSLDVGLVPNGGSSVSSFGRDGQIVTVGGRDMLVLPDRSPVEGEKGFKTFLVRDNGTLKHLKTSEPFSQFSFDQFETAQVGGQSYVVTFGSFEVAPLQVLKIKANGAMTQAFELPTSDQAIFNRITTDIENVEIGGRTFMVVSEVTAGTLLVYELKPGGELVLVEQELPGITDGWASTEAMEYFEQGGKHYIAAAGYGNGLGVFEVSKGGALTEVDEFTFTAPGIRYGYDLDVQDLGGQQYIFASTATVNEVQSFRFIPQDAGIYGNGGDNTRKGTAEDDQIFGRGGKDTLNGCGGDDMIEGGAGKDTVLGGAGRGNLFGNDGRDLIKGGADDDFLFGDDGNDRLFGQDGRDLIHGGKGNDRLNGGEGNDRLFGDAGNDFLAGNAGNDTLSDGFGADTLSGGPGFGQDVFAFVNDGTRDTITDYQDGSDRIDLVAYGRNLEFSDLVITQSGADVLVTVMGDELLVQAETGVLNSFDLSLGDFIFAS